MTIMRVDLSPLDALRQHLDEMPGALDGEMLGIIEEGAQSLLPAVVAGTPRNTSTLAQGLYAGAEAGPAQGQFTGFIAVQGLAQRYAWPVELGAVAHWPPRDAIELWVVQKQRGGDLQWTTTRSRRDGTVITKPMSVRSIAFLVARAISRHGTIKRFGYGGAEMAKKAMEAGRPQVQRIVASRIADLIRRVLS